MLFVEKYSIKTASIANDVKTIMTHVSVSIITKTA